MTDKSDEGRMIYTAKKAGQVAAQRAEDEKAAEEYAKKVWKGDSRPYNSAMRDSAIDFLAGIEHQKKKAQGLVEALEAAINHMDKYDCPSHDFEEILKEYRGEG